MKLQEHNPPAENSVTSASDMWKKFTESIDPIELVLLVLHKWWILVITIVVFSVIAIAYAKSTDDIYRASARVEIFQEGRFRDRSNTTEYDRLESNLNRHIIIMTGEMFHRELISKLRIKWEGKLEDKEFKVPFQISGVRGSGTSGSQSMIDLSVDSKYPTYALDYLESILGSYRAYRERELSQINENALAGLRSEEKRIRLELITVKNEIEQFELENKVLLAREREQMQGALITELLGRLQVIRAERLILEYQYEEVAQADVATIRETLNLNQNSRIREFLLSQEKSDDPQAQNLDSNSIVSTAAIRWLNKPEYEE